MPSDIRPSPVPSDGVISHARQPNAVPVLVADYDHSVGGRRAPVQSTWASDRVPPRMSRQ